MGINVHLHDNDDVYRKHTVFQFLLEVSYSDVEIDYVAGFWWWTWWEQNRRSAKFFTVKKWFNSSKSTIETLEKFAKVIKLTVKTTGRRKWRLYDVSYLYCWLWTYFTSFYSVSIVQFKQANFCQEATTDSNWGVIGLLYSKIVIEHEKYCKHCNQYSLFVSPTTLCEVSSKSSLSGNGSMPFEKVQLLLC